MTNKDFILNLHKKQGYNDAIALRQKAVDKLITDTEIIDNEECVPDWNNDKDYTDTPIGAPVAADGQIYALLQPHNASYYPNTHPSTLQSLWRVKHTKNPLKAKPYVAPTSTSDMYLVGECMLWTDGQVYRALRGTVYSPEEYADDWENV